MATEVTEATELPDPVLAGRFSIYLTEDERVVVGFRLDEGEETARFVIPPHLMRLASRLGGGFDILGELRKAKAEKQV